MAVHAPKVAPAPVNLKMVFPETNALPHRPTAPSTAPTHTWHNPAPAPTTTAAAVAVSLPTPHHPSFNYDAPTLFNTYSPDDFPSMIWEHSNPTPMDWDTATSIHQSNPPGRIITVGGLDIEAGTPREFREVRGVARLNKERRRRQQQQQVLSDCRARSGKKEKKEKGLVIEGRRKGVSKSRRGKRQGEGGRRGEKAEDCLMTFFGKIWKSGGRGEEGWRLGTYRARGFG